MCSSDLLAFAGQVSGVIGVVSKGINIASKFVNKRFNGILSIFQRGSKIVADSGDILWQIKNKGLAAVEKYLVNNPILNKMRAMTNATCSLVDNRSLMDKIFGGVRVEAGCYSKLRDKMSHLFVTKHKFEQIWPDIYNDIQTQRSALAQIGRKAAANVPKNYIDGTEILINIKGVDMYVRGAIVRNKFNIGTAYVK